MIDTTVIEPPAPVTLPPYTIAGMEAYLAVSGDVNPLHVDPDLAERIGLEGLPVPGMLVMAAVANYVADWPRCKTTLKLGARFTAPIYVGDELVITSRIARHPNAARPHPVLRIVATQKGRIAVVAEAELELA